MALNAFEFVRPRGALPPLVRALLYPENSPAVRAEVGPKPRAGSKWRTGKPLHAGWWLTRLGYSKIEWRWWDGKRWSVACSPSSGAENAAAAACFACDASSAVTWCMDWPEGARVPRVNPATGAVTGGVQ